MGIYRSRWDSTDSSVGPIDPFCHECDRLTPNCELCAAPNKGREEVLEGGGCTEREGERDARDERDVKKTEGRGGLGGGKRNRIQREVGREGGRERGGGGRERERERESPPHTRPTTTRRPGC
jgi:hypothetical protein